MNSSSRSMDERRRRLLDSMLAIAWSASASTFRFTYVNPAAEKVLGYPTSRWLEDPNFWAEHLHPDDRHVARFCHNETLACRDHELVYRMIAVDGRVVWLRDYVNVHSVDGEAVELFGIMVDITREREAEAASREALEASEQRYRELVDGVGDILFTLDDAGCFLSLSRGFERSTGYSVNEWIGRPFAELFHARPISGAIDAGPVDGTLSEYTLPSRTGQIVTMEVSSQPRFVEGVRSGTIGMARDVTETRTIARKLDDAKKLSSLGQLAASLAHEFNNVLMGIQPFVEVIARRASDIAGVSDAASNITRAIARGKRASQEILRFANPKEPQLRVIDAEIWLPGFLGHLRAALPMSITLSHTIRPEVRGIYGDREHLEQVITNLVFNARDAIAGPGAIHVELSATRLAVRTGEPGFVLISVSDDGPGIPPHMLERVFEPLFTTKRNGTGLGLAIARRLIEGQGGMLTAENRPEGGSVFHICVPMAAQLPAPVAGVLPHTAAPAIQSVLIVEDDEAVGAGLEALLRTQGFETTWVRAMAEASGAMQRARPDVAIIDVNLPDGSGLDLVARLRDEYHDLPIVLSTGHLEIHTSGSQARICSLMKPYELTDLLNAIGTVTEAA